MKSALLLSLSLTLTALVIGCGSHHEAADANPENHDDHSAPSSSDTAPLALSLNGEEKWLMDDHTRSMFSTMAGRFEGFEAEQASAEELAAVGDALREDIDALIAGCTMVGAGHNELHKYLGVYVPAVTALQESGQLASAQKVHGLLEEYQNFFE